MDRLLPAIHLAKLHHSTYPHLLFQIKDDDNHFPGANQTNFKRQSTWGWHMRWGGVSMCLRWKRLLAFKDASYF